jgi:hypothetical protein
MNDDKRHPGIRIIRRVRLLKDLKPISFLARPNSQEVDWLAIAHATDDTGFESFDLVFFRPDGVAFPWMGFETLKIAKDQAHAMIGVEYVEWEPCNVQITNADRTVNWERALPGAEQAACC